MGTNQGDPANATPVYTVGGTKSALCVTAATIVKAAAGAVMNLEVIVAGAPGAVYDCAATADASATANQVAVIPAAVGPVKLEFPCLVGIVVVPGAGQKVSVSYQ